MDRKTIQFDDDIEQYIKEGIRQRRFSSWSHAVNYVFAQHMEKNRPHA